MKLSKLKLFVIGFLFSQLAQAKVRELYVNSNEMGTINLKMGQSTILRFLEKPKKVVIGNQNYFNVEFVENDVTIQPLGAAKTNLFVYGEYSTYGLLLDVNNQASYDDLVIVTGAVAGASGAFMLASKNKGQAALECGLIGGAIGGIASYFLHNELELRDDRTRRDTLFNLEKFNVSAPASYQGTSTSGPGLTVPKVDAQWVDTQVQGKKLIEGHRVWVITEDPQWVPNTPKSK